ncbi:hypothetical protein ExPUPEC61_03099 [Escherichia coli]|nr:hypothetical protein ExPUPEC61_03099 [Escherichia coli]
MWQASGQRKAVQVAWHHIQLAVLRFGRTTGEGAYLAEHRNGVIRCHAYKSHITRFWGTVERDGETVAVNYGGGRRSAKALCHVIPWPAGGFIVAGENGGIYQHIAIDLVDARFFQSRDHIANILTS